MWASNKLIIKERSSLDHPCISAKPSKLQIYFRRGLVATPPVIVIHENILCDVIILLCKNHYIIITAGGCAVCVCLSLTERHYRSAKLLPGGKKKYLFNGLIHFLTKGLFCVSFCPAGLKCSFYMMIMSG